jgi:hypothetical protein
VHRGRWQVFICLCGTVGVKYRYFDIVACGRQTPPAHEFAVYFCDTACLTFDFNVCYSHSPAPFLSDFLAIVHFDNHLFGLSRSRLDYVYVVAAVHVDSDHSSACSFVFAFYDFDLHGSVPSFFLFLICVFVSILYQPFGYGRNRDPEFAIVAQDHHMQFVASIRKCCRACRRIEAGDLALYFFPSLCVVFCVCHVFPFNFINTIRP